MKHSSYFPVLLTISKRPDVISFISDHLKSDFQVIPARDLSTARDLLKDTKIDYCFIDEALVDTSLDEFLTSLISNGAAPINLYLLTSNLKVEFKDYCKSLGIKNLIYEPLDIEEILKVLNPSQMPKKEIPFENFPSFTTNYQPSNVTPFPLNTTSLKEVLNSKQIKFPLCILNLEIQLPPEILSGEVFNLLLQELSLQIRPQDLVFPQSPTKFLIFLPQTSQTAGRLLAENIKEGLSTLPQNSFISLPQLHVKIGLSFYDKHKDIEKFLQEIDKVLETASMTLGKAKLLNQSIYEYRG